MKKIIGMIVMAACISVAGQAQEKRDTVRYGNDRKAKMKMKNELGLNKEQAQKLKSSQQEFRSKREAIQRDSSLSKEAKREKVRTLHAEHQKKVDATLTPEQREKAKQLRQEKSGGKRKKKKQQDSGVI